MYACYKGKNIELYQDYQISKNWSLRQPVSSMILLIPVLRTGGPQIHTREKPLFEASETTRLLKNSRVNSIPRPTFYNLQGFVDTRSTTLATLDFSLSRASCSKVIGWMSSGLFIAIRKVKWKLVKGFSANRGSPASNCGLSGWFSSMSWVLKRRSIRSEKGKSPVPPATTMIRPEGVELSYSPLPRGLLSLTGMLRKLFWLRVEVSFPSWQTLSMRGKQPDFPFFGCSMRFSLIKLFFLLRKDGIQVSDGLWDGSGCKMLFPVDILNTSDICCIFWGSRKLTAVQRRVRLSTVKEQY